MGSVDKFTPVGTSVETVVEDETFYVKELEKVEKRISYFQRQMNECGDDVELRTEYEIAQNSLTNCVRDKDAIVSKLNASKKRKFDEFANPLSAPLSAEDFFRKILELDGKLSSIMSLLKSSLQDSIRRDLYIRHIHDIVKKLCKHNNVNISHSEAELLTQLSNVDSTLNISIPFVSAAGGGPAGPAAAPGSPTASPADGDGNAPDDEPSGSGSGTSSNDD